MNLSTSIHLLIAIAFAFCTVDSYNSRTSIRFHPSTRVFQSNEQGDPITYDRAKLADIEPIANLLVSTFMDENPTNSRSSSNPFRSLQRQYFKLEQIDLLNQRYPKTSFVNPINFHSMVVAKCNQTAVVGFVELGMVPLPSELVEANMNRQLDMTQVPCIGNVAVDTSYRRQGVATKLLEYSLNLAKQSSFDIVICRVVADNMAAIKLYKSLGFEGITCKADSKILILYKEIPI
jgi:ribosomal protein S18 acetylase RimI-like enzyme